MPSAGSLSLGLRLWGPVALYLAAITFLSHQPGLTSPGQIPDWLLHMTEYALLAALVVRALIGSGRTAGSGTAILAALGCVIFGALDELHQSFVPGREAALADVAADAAGSALVFAAAALIQSRGGRGAGRGAVGAVVEATGSTAKTGRDEAPSRHGTDTVEITLFGRRGCHLCDEAERVLLREAAGYHVRLRKVDIEKDPGLERLYGDEVPVVTIDGRKAFKLRVDAARLRRKLASLQARRRP